MIVELTQDLYVIDKMTHEHKIRYIDPINKIVYSEDTSNADGVATITVKLTSDTLNSEETQELGFFYYGTNPLTVTIRQGS